MKMHLTEVCNLLCLITIVISHTRAEQGAQDVSIKTDRRIAKREAAIFIDNFPIEPIYTRHRPKVIYRRISKQRYKTPKPKYGPPNMYRSAKPWKPSKKYPRISKPKYGPPSYKRRPTKPKYGPPKPSYKTKYGPPEKPQLSSFYPPEPISFGEPPAERNIQPIKQSFGEPPLDSYGDPVDISVRDPYVPEEDFPPSYSESLANFANLDQNYNQGFKAWQSFQDDQNFDNNVAYSRKRPIYVTPEPMDDLQDEDFDENAYSQMYKHREFYTEKKPLQLEKQKKMHGSKRVATKPRKVARPNHEPDDEVLVGGRYAEPPERYVPKFPINRQITYSAFSDDDDFTPLNGYIDPDVAISATMSPYVNYKNSNMAFSPQNLNDAFSIVYK